MELAEAAQRRGAQAQLCFELAATAEPGTALLLAGLHRGQAAVHHDQRHQQHAAQPLALAHSPHPPPHVAPRGAPRPRQPTPASRRAADRLNAGLQSIEAPGALRGAALGLDGDAGEQQQPTAAGDAAGESTRRDGWGRRLAGLAMRVGDLTQPPGEAPGDATWGERAANVLTSLPFALVGWQMHRRRLTPEGRHHAATLVAVGVAATLYHAASGRTCRLARKVDYWTIAYSSAALTKSIYADSPGVRRAANLSLLAVPFRPFAVSAVHALVMQADFLRQASQHKAVRGDLTRHYAAAALGMGAFFFEDVVMYSGWGGYVHSAWHCLACYGVATMDGLLAHKERQQLQERLRRQTDPCAPGGLAPGTKPLRRPVHSSASSLPSYGSYPRSKLGGGSPAGWSPAGASPTGASPRAQSPPRVFAP